MRREQGMQNERLNQMAKIEEGPLKSTVPIIGPFITGFRNLWNGVAAKWTYRQVIEQQNAFNAQVVQRLSELENQVYQQMVAQDRDQTHLLRETSELSTTLSQLNQILQNLELRLADLEKLKGIVEEEE